MVFRSTFVQAREQLFGIQLFDHEESISFSTHTHNETSIVICTQGALESLQFGHKETIEEDRVLITNAGIPHSSRYVLNGRRTRGVTIDLPRAELGEAIRRTTGIDYPRSMFLGSLHLPAIGGLAREIEKEHNQVLCGSQLVIDALAMQIVIQVLRVWPRPLIHSYIPTTELKLPRRELVTAIEWMHQVPLDSFTIEEISQQVNRSSSSFSRLFTKATGSSPYQFYSGVLMTRAAEMLHEEQRSIKDIALSLGFRNQSHFSYAFRARWRESPSYFRSHMSIPSNEGALLSLQRLQQVDHAPFMEGPDEQKSGAHDCNYTG
jgi:AraC-like DNA-binding protein